MPTYQRPTYQRIVPILSSFGVVTIIFFSYQGLAPQFDPWLNSDHAVHVMMTYDLQLPNDLYYWGQDRLGSLVPIVSHFMRYLIPWEPVVMVGFVNYVMLVLAYLCFASFLEQWVSRLLLAIAFFLPLRLYIEILHISQPYAAQFACMGLTSIGLRWVLEHWSQPSRWQRWLGMVATMMAMTASLWMSDFSIVYFAVVGGAIAHHWFWRLSPTERRTAYPLALTDGYTVGIMAVLGLGFLQFAKASASNSSNYTKFNSVGQLIDVIGRMGQSFGRNLRFQTSDVWLSVAAWCLVAIASTVIFLVWRDRHCFSSPPGLSPHTEAVPLDQQSIDQPSTDQPSTEQQSIDQQSIEDQKPIPSIPPIFWIGSWGLTAGLSMVILLVANWVYQPDHIAQRYFVVVYGFCWLAVLLLTEQVPKGSKRVMMGLLVVLAIANIGSLSPRMTVQPSRVEQLEELRALAPAAFIGEYWHSYVLCSADPDLFNCTPFDPWSKRRCPEGNGKPYELGYPISAVVRCERCAQNVVNSPTVYLVKQQWLERFPKHIEQFGYCFERAGKVKTVAGQDIVRYRRLDALIDP